LEKENPAIFCCPNILHHQLQFLVPQIKLALDKTHQERSVRGLRFTAYTHA